MFKCQNSKDSQDRYEKPKQKITYNSTAFEDDEYYHSIESFGNDQMHEATLHLIEKTFTDEEIKSQCLRTKSKFQNNSGKTTVFTKMV